jgi:hydroxypyruvate isomerase
VSIQQSFSWWCFEGLGLDADALLAAAARAGFEGVDLIDPALWPRVRAHGLRVAAVDGHRPIEAGLNRREHHERIGRELRERIALAARWGAPHLVCFSGNRGGLPDEDGAEAAAEGLARVAPDAESAGVTLVLELLNSRVDHPDYQADRTAWGARVVDLVGSSRVKLLYDVYHMQIMEGDLVRTIGAHHARIGHYHTAGNPGRHEIDDTQEINYRAVFRAIRDTGYAGFIGHEFVPAGEPLAALRDAFERTRAALEAP